MINPRYEKGIRSDALFLFPGAFSSLHEPRRLELIGDPGPRGPDLFPQVGEIVLDLADVVLFAPQAGDSGLDFEFAEFNEMSSVYGWIGAA